MGTIEQIKGNRLTQLRKLDMYTDHVAQLCYNQSSLSISLESIYISIAYARGRVSEKKPLLKFEYENDYANDNDILVENNDGAINHLILLFLPPPPILKNV